MILQTYKNTLKSTLFLLDDDVDVDDGKATLGRPKGSKNVLLANDDKVVSS